MKKKKVYLTDAIDHILKKATDTPKIKGVTAKIKFINGSKKKK